MKIKRIFLVLIPVFLAVGLLSACAPAATPTKEAAAISSTLAVQNTSIPAPASTTAPIVVTDALGRTVTFDQLPQRIVIAGKATPLILDSFYMFPEASSRLVAYEMRMQNGDAFLKIADPNLSNKNKLETNASAEQIAPSKPDLVILKTYMADTLGKSLGALGIKVIYVNMETPDSFYVDIRNIGKILGDSARAEEIVSYYQGKVNAISDKISSASNAPKPSVLVLEYTSQNNAVAFDVPPVSYLQTLMVSSSNGAPVWKDAADPGGWNVVTLEQIASWNPDMIFMVDYSGKAVQDVAQLKTDPQWQQLKAVKDSQLFAFPTDFLSWDQPDSRWILGLTWIASKIQPNLFPDIKITDEITSFYQKMYNLDSDTIINQILPLYKGS